MKPSRATDDRYMDVRSLSAYSGLSVRTLWDYLGDPDNSIPHFRMRRKVLVRRSEFDRWMENYRSDGNKLDVLVGELIRDL